METVPAPDPMSLSGDNPLILVQGQPDTSMKYSIEGRVGCLESGQYQIFDTIFEEHAREWDSIADGVAAELVRLTTLPEDVLAEIWDAALKATLIPPKICEAQSGYLSKDEFFILLAELQSRLALSDDDLLNTLSRAPSPLARRNPFNRKSLRSSATPPLSPTGAPPVPPKLSKEVSGSGWGDVLFQLEAQEVRQLRSGLTEHYNVADAECIRSFGSPALTLPSSNSSRSCEFLLPVKVALGYGDVEASKPSDKEVVLEHWSPTLPNVEYVKFEGLSDSSTTSLVNVTESRENDTVERTYVELEATEVRMRWSPDDFSTVHSLCPNNSYEEIEEQRPIQGDVAPRVQHEYLPLSTAFSDQIAVQRLTSLVTSESTAHRRSSMRRHSIGNALNLVRKTTMHFKAKASFPDRAASGYLYTKLAEALQDAVADGNISLVASLFNLGADVNYSSVHNRVYHNVLQVAVASGHADIVEFFISMGADGISVDNALITAFFANNIDLAVRLAPHSNIYHLRPFDTAGPENEKLSASSLGRVIKDHTMPSKTRTRLLECFLSQNYFDANKVVFQVYDTANDRLFEFSTLCTLVAQLDMETVALILTSLATVKRHIVRKMSHHMGAICCIRPSHWQLNSEKACAMLELLAEHSADVGEIAYWPGTGEMSPLACAVAGGSFEGVSILLALDADPECLVYQVQTNGKQTEPYSALGWAALKGRLDICTLLVDAGATPWRTSFEGHTPLYLACSGGSAEVVEYLLSLDVERSMVDACLIAAVQRDNLRIVEVLLTVGASITPETWIAVMKQPRKPQQRAKILSIIELLLSYESIILEEPVLAAIDADNFAGLSRVLERRNGELDFDKNAVFGNERWPSGQGEDSRDRTCLYYADQTGKRDFVALLMSYGWRNLIATSDGR